MTTLPVDPQPIGDPVFGITKPELLNGIASLQARFCGYGTRVVDGDKQGRCDCKYGVHKDPRATGEEQNGCPELSMAYRLIERMTPAEFSQLCQRADILVDRLVRDEITLPGPGIVPETQWIEFYDYMPKECQALVNTPQNQRIVRMQIGRADELGWFIRRADDPGVIIWAERGLKPTSSPE